MLLYKILLNTYNSGYNLHVIVLTAEVFPTGIILYIVWIVTDKNKTLNHYLVLLLEQDQSLATQYRVGKLVAEYRDEHT